MLAVSGALRVAQQIQASEEMLQCSSHCLAVCLVSSGASARAGIRPGRSPTATAQANGANDETCCLVTSGGGTASS